MAVLHSDVDGAVGYVLVKAGGSAAPCNEEIPNLCLVEYPSAPGCDMTLHAVDAKKQQGRPSTSFCVRPAGAT